MRQVLNQAFQGITASVGNLGVEESNAKVKRVFEASFFIGQWMFGFAAICLYELLNPFVGMSFGEQYIFSAEITLVLCLNFYFTGMRQATLVFRDSLLNSCKEKILVSALPDEWVYARYLGKLEWISEKTARLSAKTGRYFPATGECFTATYE